MPNWKKVIISGSDAALNSLEITSHLTASGLIYPTVDGTDGQAITTDAAGNLTFGNPGFADEAEKVTFEVQNGDTGTLAKGTPVHITSMTGGTAIVVAASASVASKMPSHGILNQQLTAGSDGFATILGQVTGVNTSAFSPGDTVYVGPSGGYTNVKPSGSTNLIQNLGVVKKVDASNGTGEIFGSGRTNDVPNLPTGKIWVGNDYTVTSSVIHLDEPNSRLGIGTTSPGTLLHIEGSSTGYLQTIRNTTAGGDYLQMLAETGDAVFQFESGGTGGEATLNMYRDGTQYVKISADAGVDNYFNNGANVGIGTTSPLDKLHVEGGIVIQNGNNLQWGGLYSASAPTIYAATNYLSFVPTGITGAATRGMRLTATGLGIGTTSPAYKLDVSGTARISNDIALGAFNEITGVANDNLVISVDKDNLSGSSSIDFQLDGATSALFINNSRYVGIGTTNPGAKLHIKGTTVATSETVLMLEGRANGAGEYTELLFKNSWTTDENSYIRQVVGTNTTTQDITIGSFDGTTTNEIIRFEGISSNVGIGTTSPTARLQVKGSGTTSATTALLVEDSSGTDLLKVNDLGDVTIPNGSLSLNGATNTETFNLLGNMFFDGSGTITAGGVGDSLTLQAQSANIAIGYPNAADITITGGVSGSFSGSFAGDGTNLTGITAEWDGTHDGDAEITGSLTISGSSADLTVTGNVGIGTTSPGTKLTVDAGSNIASFRSVGSGQNNKELLIQTGGDRVVLDAKNASDGTAASLAFELGNSEKARLTTAGLGIGTTSPSEKLDVVGNIRSSAEFQVFSGTTDIGQISNLSGALNIQGTSTRDVSLGSDTNPQSIFIEGSNGNVGIGTTSPGAKLHVAGGFTRFQALGDKQIQFIGTGKNTFSIEHDTARLYFYNETATSYPLTILNGGNVGIGTTSPGAKLEVAGASGAISGTGMTYLNNSDDAFSLVINNAGTSAQNDRGVFEARVGGSSVFRVNNSGNVGIGTTSPQTELHVKGNDGWGQVRVEGQTFASGHGSALEFYSGGIALADIYAGTDKHLVFRTNGVTERMRINSAGNVGIGTTNPSHLLHIESTSTYARALIKTTATGNVTAGAQIVCNDSDLFFGAADDGYTAVPEYTGKAFFQANGGDLAIVNMTNDLEFYAGGRTSADKHMVVTGAGIVGIGITSPTAKLQVRGSGTTSATTALLVENSAGTDLLKVRDDGNVGIGTTSPSAKLDVEGDINIANANISNQENTDVDAGTEVVATLAIATYTAGFFDFVIKKGTNVRSGTIYACHDGTNTVHTETTTVDLGNTSDVSLSVDISGGDMRLTATAASDDWSIKSLVRGL